MRFCFLSSLLVFCVAMTARPESAPYQGLNPIVKRWPADVLLYQSFDSGTMIPDIGYATFDAKAKNVTFEKDGVLGSCYAGRGRFDYRRKDPSIRLIDTTKPGSIIVWVKYLGEREPLKKTNGQWESGFGMLQAVGGNGNTFFLMKSADCRWNMGTIKFHLQSTKPDGKIFRGGSAGYPSSYKDWKPNEWRMVAVGWTVDKMRISVNGEPFKESPLTVTLGDFSGHFFLTSDENTRLDELVVLARGLTDEEVADIYKAFGR